MMKFVEHKNLDESDLFGDEVYHYFGGIGAVLPRDTDAEKIVLMNQVHGTRIVDIQTVDLQERMTVIEKADGLVTADPKVLLTVKTGDCVPMLWWDPIERVVAASHQGWRGTLDNMAEAMVNHLVSRGSEKRNLRIAFGSSIGPCCNQFSQSDADLFADKYPSYAHEIIAHFADDEKPHIDLRRLNFLQLVESGIEPEQIDGRASCTICQGDTYFSFRGGTYNSKDPERINWSCIMLR